MLRKILSLVAMMAFVAVATATANINVVYSGVNGFLRSDDVTGLTSPANGSQTALAQLIFRPLADGNTPDGAGVGATVGSTEQVLDEALITDSGGADAYGVLAATSYIGAYQNGFIFVRVFDQGSGLGGSGVVADTWYYDGPVVATIDNVTPANPDSYNANGANPSVTYSGFGDFLNQQIIVPEPATFALMGIGGLLLAIRRRRG